MKLKKLTWAYDHLKVVTCQRLTSKILDLDGRHLSPRYGQGYWSADTLFWQLSNDHNIDAQSGFSWVPKLARNCESKHWFACDGDGLVGVRSRDNHIFWDGLIYFPMVLRCHAGRACESSAIILLKMTKHSFAGGQRYLEWQRACFKLDKQT